MDVQAEIAAASHTAVRTRNLDYLHLLNDVLSAWDSLGSALGGLLAARMVLTIAGHDAPGGGMLREILFGSLLAALVLRDRRLAAAAGYATTGLLIRRLLVRVGLAAALLLGTGFATGSFDGTARLWVPLWAASALAATLLGRLALLLHVRRLLRCGALRSVVAVVGEGEAAWRVMHSLSRPGSGIELLGPFGGPDCGPDCDPDCDVGRDANGGRSAGSVDDLVRLVQRRGPPDRVIVATPASRAMAGRDLASSLRTAATCSGEAGWDGEDELVTMVRQLKVLPAEISLCCSLHLDAADVDAWPDEDARAPARLARPGLGGIGLGGISLGGIGLGSIGLGGIGLGGIGLARRGLAGPWLAGSGIGATVAGLGALDRLPLLRVAERPMPAWGGLAKHAVDKALAGTAVLLLSPLLLAIAAAVRLDSAGPAIFRQERDGWNGRSFTVLKFRTMRAAPASGSLLQTVKGDPRCTRLGRFLRRSSLDELPQLLNVLRGEMSLVGPRPHALGMRTEDRLGHEIIAEYAQRHRVRPGLTGLAQVRGLRGATHTAAQLRARVECDLDYIERWSFLLDLRILAMTAVKVFSSAGAF